MELLFQELNGKMIKLFKIVISNFKRFELKPNPKDYSTITGIGSVIPVQVEAYFLILKKYLKNSDRVLDVGFGLGYGMNILSIRAKEVYGIEVDLRVLEYCRKTYFGKNPKLKYLNFYNGYDIKFPDKFFDVVSCVDTLEHVEDYERLLREMLRVSKRGIFISTPNQRPEYTNPDGTPKNYWHLREWQFKELNRIVKRFGKVEWNFINGQFDGPFTVTKTIKNKTLALSPFISKKYG